jgi:hypothetical protein
MMWLKVLGINENFELYIQQKIFHPKIDIDSVVLTGERIIFRHPHALRLREDSTDYSYMDISEVVLDKEILRSTIGCDVSKLDICRLSKERIY